MNSYEVSRLRFAMNTSDMLNEWCNSPNADLALTVLVMGVVAAFAGLLVGVFGMLIHMAIG